jgi:hypothetical protein
MTIQFIGIDPGGFLEFDPPKHEGVTDPSIFLTGSQI